MNNRRLDMRGILDRSDFIDNLIENNKFAFRASLLEGIPPEFRQNLLDVTYFCTTFPKL